MHVRTDIRAGQPAANETEQNLQNVCNAVMKGVQNANQMFDPFKLAGLVFNPDSSSSAA
jgi:hypothetical protein